MNTGEKVLVGILLVAIIGAIALLEGIAINQLWLWFIVPKFGLPELGIPTAIGLGILVSLMATPSAVRTQTAEEQRKTLINVFLKPIYALGLGLIVALFL